ncbi:MAG: acetate--CoA ligase family protein [Candidatus Latescibacteria bacterium]|nr:acetate--CoA ligase family protein [Candidatus Latescibacterota bacterium]
MAPETDSSQLTPVFKAKTLEDARQRARQERALKSLFEPNAIAVIGASRREGSVGHSVFKNLLMNGYTGTLYPINPKNPSIMGVKCHQSVMDIEEAVDMAVIAIPAAGVSGVIDECARKGIHSAIVLSAGFKEVGSEGAQLELALRCQAEEAGIALLGPNCLGLINTDPALSMNASFARSMAQPGNIAFISQSGALCTSILDYARANHIGFSKFISFGNKSDVDELDLLQYLAGDPQTEVILMYIEELSEGQRFIHVARHITAELGKHNKPILAIKTGRTAEGASAAASHTGSLAGTDEVYDAIMAQAGVLRVDTVQELFGYAVAFASQPMPKGNRVAIVTNAGGPGIMTTDACVRQGLQLARFSEATQAKMAASLPAEASLKNPVDLIGDARSDRYAAALEAVMADEKTDAALVILTPQTMTDIEEVGRVVARFSQLRTKPVIASFMGGLDVAAGVEILRQGGVPHYPFPEEGARVLRSMWQYSQWRERPRTEERIFPVDRARVNDLLSGAMATGRYQLPESEALEVLEAYGFPVPKRGLARSRAEVEAVCAAVGYPLVMKIASPDILHKTDVGGVAVGVKDLAEALQKFDSMTESARRLRPNADIWGVAVQQLAAKGRELILGATRDPRFGTLIMFGLGGIYAEVLKDVTFRLAPLRPLGARNMLEQIRGRKILEGVRGEKPADMDALQECLERLSQLVVEFPLIKELDINPLLAYEHGALVVDARIILQEE